MICLRATVILLQQHSIIPNYVKTQLLRMKNLLIVLLTCTALTGIFFPASAQPSVRFTNALNVAPEGFYNPEIIGYTSLHTGAAALSLVSAAATKMNSLKTKYAQLLNRNTNAISNLMLFGFIEKWWKTKYRFGGQSKRGIDCSALTSLLMSCVYAVKLPRTAKEQ